MFRLLIDTCVWIDLAKDARHETLLTALETLVGGNYVKLLLPQTVVVEFDRNKGRIVEESKKSFTSVLKRMRGVADRLGDAAKKKQFLDHLGELDYALPRDADTATRTIARIERLFATAKIVETSDEILTKAAKRGVEKKAPFHRSKNSIADAILLETYAMAVEEKKKDVQLIFVTHNVNDFSLASGDQRIPHEDIAAFFDGKQSSYFITLGDALHFAEPEVLEHTKFEEEFHQEPRSLTEILEAMELLFDQVWYNRHQVLKEMIADGRHKIAELPKGKRRYDPNITTPEIWKGAQEAAKRVEKKRRKENLGPWDDFEWGMVNGKLSALRWVLGDEWDMLDT